MKLSIVINADTRPQRDSIENMFAGVCNEDFLTDGVRNKIKFFEGFDIEVIIFVDEHLPIPETVLQEMRELCHIVVISKHKDSHAFNDYNYLRAFSMATGDVIVHFDQDTAAFTSGKKYVDELLSYLDKYKFVSYPSHWTPNAVTDPSFGGYMWASTRFFMCKKDAIRIDELRHCIEDAEWAYQTYGDRPRRMNWIEHFLTLTNNNSVYYPPVELHKGAIFSWASYSKYTLRRLNLLDFEAVKQWVLHRGGINYPVDLKCD